MSRFELMGRPVEVKVWPIIKRLTKHLSKWFGGTL